MCSKISDWLDTESLHSFVKGLHIDESPVSASWSLIPLLRFKSSNNICVAMGTKCENMGRHNQLLNSWICYMNMNMMLQFLSLMLLLFIHPFFSTWYFFMNSVFFSPLVIWSWVDMAVFTSNCPQGPGGYLWSLMSICLSNSWQESLLLYLSGCWRVTVYCVVQLNSFLLEMHRHRVCLWQAHLSQLLTPWTVAYTHRSGSWINRLDVMQTWWLSTALCRLLFCNNTVRVVDLDLMRNV